jgi:cobyrinic acid a,c-diamide synthase
VRRCGVGWVKNKLKTWGYSRALNCVVLETGEILRGREFHTGTMRDRKKKEKLPSVIFNNQHLEFEGTQTREFEETGTL